MVFYKTPEGNFGNRVGDWSDIIDLDYNQKELWDYQIETLKQWVKRGIDGFRCDVAPLVPLKFWLRAREELDSVKEDLIWLAESVHPEFIRHLRSRGMVALSDSEVYQAFDMTYDYDVEDHRQAYLENRIDLTAYIERLQVQDYTYPWNYIKLRNLENHDHLRFITKVQTESELYQWTAFNYMQLGASLIYNGQEVQSNHTPSLFDKDTINWNTQTNMSKYLSKLAQIKKEILPTKVLYSLEAINDKDKVDVRYEHNQQEFIGVFNLKENKGELDVNITDGTYKNMINDQEFSIDNGTMNIKETPAIFQVNNFT
ncbi:alpha-amylase family glycosyl hydrolase [Aerococcaceae bacterium WGS1372]